MFKERSNALVYGLNYPARCIAPQYQSDAPRFFIGTQSLTEQNQVHLVQVVGDPAELKRIRMYAHQHEIWGIVSSPFDANMFFTIYNTVPQLKASLWRINDEISKLEEVTQISALEEGASVRNVVFNPNDSNQVLSTEDGALRLWDLNTSKEISNFALAKDSGLFSAGSWNNNIDFQFIVAEQDNLIFVDVRSGKESMRVKGAHQLQVRDVEFNPNQPYYLVTGGDDCKTKFWDSRKLEKPIRAVGHHQHWYAILATLGLSANQIVRRVVQTKFNHFKDALVVTTSTDSSVNLWNMGTLAFRDPTAPEPTEPVTDRLIRKYKDHEDSVYSACWSWADSSNPWLFASVSYDGRVIINKVPQHEIDQLTTDVDVVDVEM